MSPTDANRDNGSSQASATPNTLPPPPAMDGPLPSSKGEGNAFAPGTSGPSLPPVSLPSGGGAIRGMGENFAMNAAQGTATFTIPFSLSKSRPESELEMGLEYDSGGGGGVWGIGWHLSGIIDVTRQTRLGLPKYQDGGVGRAQEDIFVISGAEDLVPVYKRDGKGSFVRKSGSDGSVGGGKEDYVLDEAIHDGFTVCQYRPRIEGLFSLVERWTDQLDPEDIHWRLITPTNEMIILGRDERSRIMAANGDGKRIFSWLCCEWYDCHGNARMYEYKAENSDGVDLGQANEQNRAAEARGTQRHLKRIKYGNRTPIADRNIASAATAKLDSNDWMFEVVFDYGEHDIEDPKPLEKEGQVWACRKDPFSSFKSGFEVRNYRLCRRVLMFHHFPEEQGRLDYLVGAVELGYSEDAAVTYLKHVRQAAFVLRGPSDPTPTSSESISPYLVKRLPPLDLEYTRMPTSEQLQQLSVRELNADEAGLGNLPEGIQGSYQWIDLLCEGINGILLTDPEGEWYYKRNLSAANAPVPPQEAADLFSGGPVEIKSPKFGPLERVASRPSLRKFDVGPSFLDLDADGRLHLAITEGPTPGFYRSTNNPATTAISAEGQWEPFQPFSSWPIVDTNDPNLRFIDLTGDGKADILISHDDIFVWYESLGEGGFKPSMRTIPLALEEERGPRILFSDPTETIHLADFSGDGMVDIGRVRNGEVCYWPNMGYGRFGAKVVMDNAPVFDSTDGFSFRRLLLGDIDGSGTTDLVYFHATGATLYFNLAGNAWSEPLPLESLVPEFDSLTTVTAMDLLSSGTMCLVWSSSHPTDAGSRSLRYVDLTAGQKPHLLSKVVNNMGIETCFFYSPSTTYYLQDLAAGIPWATRLPYPEHCIDRIITYDRVSQVAFSHRYRYHHGYFDAVEREYRGFGMVEEWETEQFASPGEPINSGAAKHAPSAHRKKWFHTGAFTDHERLSRAYAREYYGAPGPDADERATAFESFFDSQLRDHLPANSDKLSDEDLREVSRALKGSLLRMEVYADDGAVTAKASVPYQVVDVGNSVRMMQPRGNNQYSVFQVFAREHITYDFEREASDPKIEHSFLLDVDDFGNELESALVYYGRNTSSPPSDLEERDRQRQRESRVTYTRKDYTNLVRSIENYRKPQASGMRKWEVTKFVPTNESLLRFTPAEFARVGDMVEITFDQKPHPTMPQKRLLEHSESLYRRNDLSGILPFGEQESLGLPGVEYHLCLTASMISIFHRDAESLLPDAATVLRTKGGYVDWKNDGNWWIPKPRVFYHHAVNVSPMDELSTAKASFFSPQRVQDEFGGHTLIGWDPHFLSHVSVEDPLGNVATGVVDYRTLQLRSTTDINGNRSDAVRDAAGIVVGLAIMDKDGELGGDTLEGLRSNLTDDEITAYFQNPSESSLALLAGASSRFIYDVNAYWKRGADSPVSTSVVTRVFHRHDQPAPSKLIEEPISELSISYLDGHGRVTQSKKQAESPAFSPASPRWRGTDWAVFNHEGLPVQEFEPFFDESHRFRLDRREGVPSIHLYDPLTRPIGMILPDKTWSKEVRGAWQIASWDTSDSVANAVDTDEDVGGAVLPLSVDVFRPSWYEARKDGGLGIQEQKAAAKALAHANTPTVAYLDALGKQIILVHDNGSGDKILTRMTYDISGNILETRDGLDRVVTEYRYNMSGHVLFTQSTDSGPKWDLADVRGKPVLSWDGKGNRLRTEYDPLRRPVGVYSQNSGREALVHKTVYGESQPDSRVYNLRGRVFREYDQGGVATQPKWDFKGNPLLTERQFSRDYKTLLDWVDPTAIGLGPHTFQTRKTFDALNRVATVTSPDQSVLKYVFNKGGLLHSITGNLKGEQQTTTFLAASEYDAHSRATVTTAGNNTTTTDTFDQLTQRLASRIVIRQEGSTRTVVQSLTYTYDPHGNVTFVRNDADQAVFFRNGAVEPHSEYTYDAIYRLIEASGREHVGQTKGAPSGPGMPTPASTTAAQGDSSAMVRYVEQYSYDAANNMTTLRHQLADPQFPGWTRRFSYESAGDRRVSNHLMSTTVGNVTQNYTYDANGNMASLPHMSSVQWDYANRLHSSSQQILADGTPETTWYVYNGGGQRVRKVTERQAAANAPESPPKLHERLIIEDFEIYRRYGTDGEAVVRQCETLHIDGGEDRLALVEHWSSNGGDGDFPSRLIRFQVHGLLQSVSVELDESGVVVSYEEYSPFGSSTYHSLASKAPKRFRYSGKERDKENGLYYFGQRYYLPWLCRWMSPDPIGIGDGLNVYAYVDGNPIVYEDPDGNGKILKTKPTGGSSKTPPAKPSKAIPIKGPVFKKPAKKPAAKLIYPKITMPDEVKVRGDLGMQRHHLVPQAKTWEKLFDHIGFDVDKETLVLYTGAHEVFSHGGRFTSGGKAYPSYDRMWDDFLKANRKYFMKKNMTPKERKERIAAIHTRKVAQLSVFGIDYYNFPGKFVHYRLTTDWKEYIYHKKSWGVRTQKVTA